MRDMCILADSSFGNTKVRIAKFKEMFYQRNDLHYPGKILAIIPLSEEQKRKINWDFMKIKSDPGSVYENIRESLSRNLY